MQVTPRQIQDVIEEYLNILESSGGADYNKIMLVRECADAVRDINIKGVVRSESLPELKSKVINSINTLKYNIRDELNTISNEVNSIFGGE